MFRGIYNGKQSHQDDLSDIIERGWFRFENDQIENFAALQGGVEKIMITGTDHEDSVEALKLAQTHGMFIIFEMC